MNLIDKIREIVTRRALKRRFDEEMFAISDAELLDLDLSYAKLTEMSRQHRLAA